MRLSVSRAVLRLGPAWSVVAGAVAVGALRPDAGALLRVLTAAILADLAWGAIRQTIPVNVTADHVAVAAQDVQPPSAAAPAVGFLPYAQAGAPLARWLVALTPAQPVDVVLRAGGALTGAWQGVLIVTVLAFVLSLLLGWPALLLTGCALATIWLAAALARRGDQPALAHACLDSAWPWLLGMSLALGQGSLGSRIVGAGVSTWTTLRPGLWLALAFTVLQWGHYSRQMARPRAAGGTLLAWCGQLGVLAALIGLQSPWAVGCVAALLVVPSFWLVRSPEDAVTDAWLGRGPLPWWWAASLVAAFAVR